MSLAATSCIATVSKVYLLRASVITPSLNYCSVSPIIIFLRLKKYQNSKEASMYGKQLFRTENLHLNRATLHCRLLPACERYFKENNCQHVFGYLMRMFRARATYIVHISLW